MKLTITPSLSKLAVPHGVRPTRRHALLLAALLVAACGPQTGAAPPASAPAAAPRQPASGLAPVAASNTALRKLTVTEPTHSVGYLPLYVAQRRGYFAE